MGPYLLGYGGSGQEPILRSVSKVLGILNVVASPVFIDEFLVPATMRFACLYACMKVPMAFSQAAPYEPGR